MVKILTADTFILSPTDLTAAASCELGWLRAVDEQVGRIAKLEVKADAMLEEAARLGDAHELKELERLRNEFGPHDPVTSKGVVEFARPNPYTAENLRAAHDTTISALKSGADVIFQAVFFDGVLAGFADFIRRNDNGEYEVWDTKLARKAKVTALLQIAAYADFLQNAGIPISMTGYLLLGNNKESAHKLDDIIPVYRDRRRRLENLLVEHLAEQNAVEWNDPRYSMCGSCAHCSNEIESHHDLLLVAGMRQTQRKKLRTAGIETIHQLAKSQGKVPELADRTLEKLRAQASLQVQQQPADENGHVTVLFDIFDGTAISMLPKPDEGDIFFDFEGDPLWSDSQGKEFGLEYLFGLVELDGSPRGHFIPFWAHTMAEEKKALIEFFDHVRNRREKYPDMHIYHYAAYEKTALRKLVVRHQYGEDFLDDLLRDELFVDLYSTVRASLRVSQPSNSIKKLEPLYMGDQLRNDDGVTTAGDSIVVYHRFVEAHESGDNEEAEKALENIADYNWYDCTSTWRLRDWLLDNAPEAPAPEATESVLAEAETAAVEATSIEQVEPVVERLLAYVPEEGERTDEETAIALLASAVGLYRREMKPFWWAYFERLSAPSDEWQELRGTLIAETQGDVRLVSVWAKESNERTVGRTIELIGRLEPASTLKVGSAVRCVYETIPKGMKSPERATRAVGGSAIVVDLSVDDAGRDVISVREKAPRDCATFDELPMAVFEFGIIRTEILESAVVELAEKVLSGLPGPLPSQATIDILARRLPRLDGGPLTPVVESAGGYVDAIYDSLQSLDHSYLAVQGPPGTGKTHVGSHVVKELIAAGWKIGVVAQSHAVVENFLAKVVETGADRTVVGKVPKDGDKSEHPWVDLDKKGIGGFLASDGGRLLGGTAWTFANEKYVARESLDLLVIDEAGQFSLANTIAVSVAAQRLLLLGDPQQLPQVTQGTHPEPVDTSALEWIANGHQTLPPDRGYFLEKTWRMHSALSRVVSRLSYESRLQSQVENTDQRHLKEVAPGLHLVEVEHEGNDVFSHEEADAIVEVIAGLIARPWQEKQDAVARPLTAAEILVVAPYNAQVGLLRQTLAAAGFPETRVGTVDKFQGQEAPVVLVSMTSSSADDVPRGMEFLLSRNRLNVAISRGQWAAFVVCSSNLIDYLPETPLGLAELGAFLRLGVQL